MLYLRACPKCRGDVAYQRDVYGNYLECLQCGLIIDSRARPAVTQKLDKELPAAA